MISCNMCAEKSHPLSCWPILYEPSCATEIEGMRDPHVKQRRTNRISLGGVTLLLSGSTLELAKC